MVALARAGQVDTARDLVRYFADKDFFGGFGAEADAPGLSLWAMEEVAVRVNSREYDRFLWPHVYRKAEFSLGMQSTKEPIERIFAGMLVPIHRADSDAYKLAEPARDGLIRGRMDLHYPAMYATAESYNGLLMAAELAGRLNGEDDARRWRAAAVELKQAWNAAYQPNEHEERTWMSGLWPTWIAPNRATYLEGMDSHLNVSWDATRGDFRTPTMWTYFTFSFAHQYVYLDKPEQAWRTLQWFFNHQPSPGLYSW